MTWDDARERIWHVFHDPMRDNVWSLVGLILITGGGMAMLFLLSGRVYALFRRRKKGDDMPAQDDRERASGVIGDARARTTDDEVVTERLTVPDGVVPLGVTGDGSRAYRPPVDVENSGVHALPDSSGAEHRVDCEHCGGTGYVTRSTNDLLRESLALVGDGGDMIVKEFYTRLIYAAPDLAPLFPADLTTAQTADPTSAGAVQRDRLLHALIALADSYNPGDSVGMERLDTALGAFGRAHAAFARPDGTTRGASLEEYAAVKSVLFETLADAAGDAWIDAYTVAWSEAYDYAAASMMHEQHRAGFRYPRAPRS